MDANKMSSVKTAQMAAEEYVANLKEANPNFSKVSYSSCGHAFLAGVLWAKSNDPDVLALVEAVEWYSDGIYPGDESQVGNSLRCGRRAREALANYRKSTEAK